MKPKNHCCSYLTFTLVLLLVAIFLVPAPTPAQEEQEKKQPLTLQNIFASGLFRPTPGQFMWKPDGKSFLYMYQGVLWRFDIETAERTKISPVSQITSGLMEGRETAHETEDDANATGRFNRAAMSLSPDGKMLLGSFDSDIYVYYIETGEARFLTDDPEPEIFGTFSPDNEKVAYVKFNDLHVLDLSGGAEKRLTDNGGNEEVWNGVADWVYEEELSVRRAFWWSPSSDKIAYLQFDTSPVKYFRIIDHLELRPEPEQQKFPLAGEENSIVRLGIVGLDGGDTVWVNTGENTDIYLPRADWTGSGQELSYYRLNRD